MENLQSAEKAYKQLAEMEELMKAQGEQLKAAQSQLNAVEELNKRSNEQLTIEAMKRQLEEKDKIIAEYQDLNQKLFLKVGLPVDEKPEDIMSQEERANKQEVDTIKEKLKIQHEKEQQQIDKELKGE